MIRPCGVYSRPRGFFSGFLHETGVSIRAMLSQAAGECQSDSAPTRRVSEAPSLTRRVGTSYPLNETALGSRAIFAAGGIFLWNIRRRFASYC
jgi:hypothetical protein